MDVQALRKDQWIASQKNKTESNARKIQMIVIFAENNDKTMSVNYHMEAGTYMFERIDFYNFLNSVKNVGTCWAAIKSKCKLM